MALLGAVNGKLANHTHIRVERWRRLHAVRNLVGSDRPQADTVAAGKGETGCRRRTNASSGTSSYEQVVSRLGDLEGLRKGAYASAEQRVTDLKRASTLRLRRRGDEHGIQELELQPRLIADWHRPNPVAGGGTGNLGSRAAGQQVC